MYIPKSKIQKLQATPQDNFINTMTREPYVGPYVKLSDGSTFAGNNATDLRYKITKKVKDEKNSVISHSRDASIYSVLKTDVRNFFR